MREIKNYIQKKKYILLFLVILFVFGLVVGMIYGGLNLDIVKLQAENFAESINTQGYNYLFIHFFLLVLSLVLSYYSIGIPILCTIVFYEGMSFGFLLLPFTASFGISGFLFSLIFTGITKGIYWIILFFFFLKCLEIARKKIGSFIYKSEKPNLVTYRNACILFIFLLFFYDGILALFGTKIVSLFSFLLI